MSVDLEDRCVCGHVRGIHSSDGTRPCHYGGLTKETQTCDCEQFISEETVDEQVPGTQVVRRADVAMFDAEPMPTVDGNVRPQVHLLSMTHDPLGAIAAACKMYKGEVVRDLEEVTDDERRAFWEDIKKTHLKAPLEFVDLHFLIEGVTRAFTHQLVRQRTAVYAQESLRFAVKDNMAAETPVPISIRPGTPEELIWSNAIDDLETSYNSLIDMGIPAEDARGLLPHQVTTRVHYKTNLRNLLDHAGNRLCTQAQFEWRWVFGALVESIRGYDPYADLNGWEIGPPPPHLVTGWQFELIANDNLFHPVCFDLGHCPFEASFDRHCNIRDRVREGRFDEIKPQEWLMNPAAARRAE